MAYKEPGVYLDLVTNPKFATGSTPMLIPLIMGNGIQIMKRTDVITRAASGDKDYLPANAETILAVGKTTRKATYFQSGVAPDVKDFIFKKGWDENLGARPIKRAIQRLVEDEISMLIISKKAIVGDIIQSKMNKDNDKIVYTIKSSNRLKIDKTFKDEITN